MYRQKTITILSAIIIATNLAFSQGTAINSTGAAADSSAILDVSSTTQGQLMPRMTTTQRNAIVSPARGLFIYNLDCDNLNYYNGSSWVPFGNVGSVATPGAITGNTSPCRNATGEVYTISPVSGASGYNWSVSQGASITEGQGTTSVTVDFDTVNGSICVTANNQCGSSTANCLPVVMQTPVSAPVEGSHTAQRYDITWRWNVVSGASGYRWNTVNDYNSAQDMSTNTSKNETSLNCETSYTRYVWSYNTCGHSTSTVLTSTTTACCGEGTGGAITHSGGKTIHTFTSSGTFVPDCAGNFEILVVAGGGGSGVGWGGGGGGGVVYNSSVALSAASYSVTVGNGGAGAPGIGIPGSNGGNSVFNSPTPITAIGGGGGGSFSCSGSNNGQNGGSGGGGGGADGGCSTGSGGTGTSGQGYNGGNGTSRTTINAGGGGGGAGAAGTNAYNGGPSGDNGGNGGNGLAFSISGSSVYYGGGGGSGSQNTGTIAGTGGLGGGGNGSNSGPGTAGSANSGGGGGGGGGVSGSPPGANGGSGVVIISYITP